MTNFEYPIYRHTSIKKAVRIGDNAWLHCPVRPVEITSFELKYGKRETPENVLRYLVSSNRFDGVTVIANEVFFKKSDAELAHQIRKAIDNLFDNAEKPLDYKIQKRRASVTIRMYKLYAPAAMRAVRSALVTTFKSVPPYCFCLEKNDDLTLTFSKEQLAERGLNPKLNKLILRNPHGLTIKSVRILLYPMGFKYSNEELEQMMRGTTYYKKGGD